jgi:hypothetical protein
MNPKDHLFALISSMKGAEKAYFKKIKMAFRAKDHSLLEIFDLLQKTDEYDEKKIIKSLGKNAHREFFASKKYLLYGEILDCLVFSKMKSDDMPSQINRLLSHSLILKEKLLFDDALKILQKAHKMATENELFIKVAEINNNRIEILHQQKSMVDFSFSTQIEFIRNESLHTFKIAQNAEEYFILSDTIYRKGELYRHTSNEEIKSELNLLFNHELLSNEGKATSKTALVCFHFVKYFMHMSFKKDLEKACYHLKKLIELQALLDRFPIRSRFTQMANYVRIATEAGKNEDAAKMLNAMIAIVEETKDIYLQMMLWVHQDYYYSNKGNFNEYVSFHAMLENEHKSLIEEAPFNKDKIDLLHSQFHYFFISENHKKAFQISNELDTQYHMRSFKNLKIYEKILKIICGYEMADNDIMQTELRSLKYLLKSTDDILEVEKAVIQLLEKLTKKDDKRYFEEFINQYKEHKKSDKYSFLFDSFKFDLWVKAKCEKVLYKNLLFDRK